MQAIGLSLDETVVTFPVHSLKGSLCFLVLSFLVKIVWRLGEPWPRKKQTGNEGELQDDDCLI